MAQQQTAVKCRFLNSFQVINKLILSLRYVLGFHVSFFLKAQIRSVCFHTGFIKQYRNTNLSVVFCWILRDKARNRNYHSIQWLVYVQYVLMAQSTERTSFLLRATFLGFCFFSQHVQRTRIAEGIICHVCAAIARVRMEIAKVSNFLFFLNSFCSMTIQPFVT